MNQLKVIGNEHIGQVTFSLVNGLFHDDRTILASEVAHLHHTTVDELDAIVASHKQHFTPKDVLDLTTYISKEALKRAGWGNRKHVYLFSGVGYGKLLFLLPDEFAWELYEAMLDV